MAAINELGGFFLGTDRIPNHPLANKVNEVVKRVNSLSGGNGSINASNITVTGVSDVSGGIKIASNVTQYTTTVNLTATQIVGTDPEKIGHVGGVTLVAAPGAGKALELVSAVLVYTFDTAAYTGGDDDLTIQDNSGTPFTGAITTASLLGAGFDSIVKVNFLAAAGVSLSENTKLALIGTPYTNGGAANGILDVIVTYNEVTI